MLEILQFIFSGFWNFIGVTILIATIMDGIVEIVKAVKR